MTTPESPAPYRALGKVLCSLVPFGLGFSAFLLLPKHLAEQQASSELIGSIASAMSLAVVLATPVASQLSERLSNRSLAAFGGVVLAGSSAAFNALPQPGMAFIVLRATQGLAFCFVLTACFASMTQVTPRRHLGRFAGYIGAGNLAAQAISPALFEPLVSRFGWSVLFWAAAGCGGLVVLASRWLPTVESAPAARTPPRTERLPVVQPASLWPWGTKLLPCLAVSAATGFSYGTVVTFAPLLALQRGADSISALFVAYTAAALTVRIGAGSLGDRLGHGATAVGTGVLYGVVVGGFADLQPAYLAALGAALGLSHGLLFPSLNVLALGQVPRRRHGSVQAYFYGAFHLGMGSSGLVLGAALPHFGYSAIFWGAGALSVAASALLWPLFVTKASRTAP